MSAQSVAEAALEFARAQHPSRESLDAKYHLALQIQPGLPQHIIDALAIIVPAVYAAGVEDGRGSLANAQAREDALR